MMLCSHGNTDGPKMLADVEKLIRKQNQFGHSFFFC